MPTPAQLEALYEAFTKYYSPNNFNVYIEKIGTPNYTYDFQYVYFYYIKFSENGNMDVRHYTYSVDDGIGGKRSISYDVQNLQAIAATLTTSARAEALGQKPTHDGSSFNAITWKKRGYIIFLVDHPGWYFHDKYVQEPGIGFSGTPNHSFYDATTLSVKTQSLGPDDDGLRTAIAAINYMKRNEKGDDLLDEKDSQGNPIPITDHIQTFTFELCLDTYFKDKTAAPVLIKVDPSGTNQGPP